MDKTRLGVTSKSSGTEKEDQGSALTKDAAARRRTNIRMVRNVLLIWLNNTIDNNSADCRNSVIQLRRAVNTVITFTDSEECIQFIEEMRNDKACVIISGSLGSTYCALCSQ
jgi:hypothetical protein